MKKMLCFMIALAAVMSVSSCGSKGDRTDNTAPAAQTTKAGEAAQDGGEAQAEENTTGTNEGSQQAAYPGVLYQLNEKDDEAPVITGVKLVGNRSGSEEGINGKPVSDKDIRCIFELNEWISVIPDTEKRSGLAVYIVEHQEDTATYTDSFFAALNEETPRIDLNAPEEEGAWGELYVSSDEHEAGDYDMVFADGFKPVGMVRIKLYKEDELSDKSDADLESMMKQLAEK